MSSQPPTTSTPQQPPAPPPLNFIGVLREMLRASDKVSDLIFSPGRPPQIELAGKLVPVRVAGLEKLTPAHTAGIAKIILGNQQAAVDSLEKTGSADLSFSLPGDARLPCGSGPLLAPRSQGDLRIILHPRHWPG